MAPFRSGPERGETPQAQDTVRDAVEQMVEQFADRLAFWRELVQNAIDAGATRCDAVLVFDPDEQALRLQLHDDGRGMNREVIERALLVLFRSTKEGDRSKIGKFGVGFFSVFAVEPLSVVVDTGTGPDGWRLTVDPHDYGWELEEIAPRRGTTVTLHVRRNAEDARRVAHESFAALDRWCEHVTVPVHVRCVGLEQVPADRRADRPFGLDAAAAVVHVDPGSERAFAVGLGRLSSVSFYNRGMLIHRETGAGPGVIAKASAPELSHTISRDDVRRDRAWSRAVERIEELTDTALRDRTIAVFGEAARAWAGRSEPGAAETLETIAHALMGHVELRAATAAHLELPLVTPVGGAVTLPLGRVPNVHHWAAQASPVSEALAAQGTPVLDAAAAGGAVRMLVERILGHGVDADEVLCAPGVIADEALTDRERALLVPLGQLLAATGIPKTVLARPAGAGSARPYLALAPGDLRPGKRPLLLDASDVAKGPFALLRNRALAVPAGHPRTRAALQAAEKDPVLAAWALARTILLHARALDAKRDQALLAKLTELRT